MTLLHQAAQKAVEARDDSSTVQQINAPDAGPIPEICDGMDKAGVWSYAHLCGYRAALQQQPEPVALAQDHPAPGWYWISVEGAEPVPARIWREFDSLPDSRLLFVPFGTFAPNDPRDWRHERECRAPEERNAALCIVAPIPLYAAPPALQHQEEPSTAVIPPAPPECETEDEKTAFAFGYWQGLHAARKGQEVPREPVATLRVTLEYDDGDGPLEIVCHGTELNMRRLDARLKFLHRLEKQSNDCAASPSTTRHQEVPREPVAADAKSILEQVANAPNEENCAMCNGRGFYGIPGQRCSFCKGTGRVQWRSAPDAASPSTTRQQEVGSVPPAKLVNGQWEGAPLSQFPELQEQVRKGLADGSIQIGCGDASVEWTPEDEKRLDDALAKRAAARAAAPSTPEKAGGVPANRAACEVERDAAKCWREPCAAAGTCAAPIAGVPACVAASPAPRDYWIVARDCAVCGRMATPGGPCQRAHGVSASVPHPLPEQANDGGEHG